MADATLLPFEFTNLAETIAGYLEDVGKLPRTNVDLTALRKSTERLWQASDDFDRALRAKLLTGGLTASQANSINRLLFLSERKLLSDKGLPRREWFKHQIYAPGFYTGYGVKTLPGVREALEQKNWEEAASQSLIISATLDNLSTQIESAIAELRKK